jgi:dTDP-4-amino-4,6-dideoxygalactose transaminase
MPLITPDTPVPLPSPEVLAQFPTLAALEQPLTAGALATAIEQGRVTPAQAADYLDALASTGLVLPTVGAGNMHTWHLFVVRTPHRQALQQGLAALGVETLNHYPVPPHLQPAYATLGLPRGSLPIAEAIHDEVLSLPMGPHLSDAEAGYVIDSVQRVLAAG